MNGPIIMDCGIFFFCYSWECIFVDALVFNFSKKTAYIIPKEIWGLVCGEKYSWRRGFREPFAKISRKRKKVGLQYFLCTGTTSSVSEIGCMDSENQSVVLWKTGSHSVKLTVSRREKQWVYMHDKSHTKENLRSVP